MELYTQREQLLFTQRKCLICECDISHKKASAKTCSRHCRAKMYNSYLQPLDKIIKSARTNQGFLFSWEQFFDFDALVKKAKEKTKIRRKSQRGNFDDNQLSLF